MKIFVNGYELFNLPPAFIYETRKNSSTIKLTPKRVTKKKKMNLTGLGKKPV